MPCFFDVVKSQIVAGERLQQGTKSCRMGRNFVCPSVRLHIRPSARPSFGWSTSPPSKGAEGQLEGSEGLPEGSEGLSEGSEGLSEGSEGLLKGPEGLSEMYVLYGFSPHFAQLCPLSGLLPKGILRSAVPLPCFFDVLKSQLLLQKQIFAQKEF